MRLPIIPYSVSIQLWIVPFGLAVLVSALVIPYISFETTGSKRWMLFGLVFVFQIAVWIVGGVHGRRGYARLKACGLLLCTRCGYDLRGLDEEGACPECGTRYTHASTKSQWRVIFPQLPSR